MVQFVSEKEIAGKLVKFCKENGRFLDFAELPVKRAIPLRSK
jgi:hypothetical protein